MGNVSETKTKGGTKIKSKLKIAFDSEWKIQSEGECEVKCENKCEVQCDVPCKIQCEIYDILQRIIMIQSKKNLKHHLNPIQCHFGYPIGRSLERPAKIVGAVATISNYPNFELSPTIENHDTFFSASSAEKTKLRHYYFLQRNLISITIAIIIINSITITSYSSYS